MTAPDLSLVVACYDEGATFEDSVAETLGVLDGMAESCEVIFVDDASRDGTREAIARIVAANPHREMRAIVHESNLGRGAAVSDGIRAARGRIVGFLDIDLEVHARHIPPCVSAVCDGWDVATVQRGYPFRWRDVVRFLLSRGYRRLVRGLLRVPLEDTESGFKFFARERILPILEATTDVGWFWDTEVMVRSHFGGLRIVEIPAPFVRRRDKRSTVRPLRDSVEYLVKLLRFRRTAAELRGGRR